MTSEMKIHPNVGEYTKIYENKKYVLWNMVSAP